ncbi:MAG: glutamine amidotransferase-related protein, partial [Bacilli bacterium]
LILDNYDSFTYNIYQKVGSINSNVKVIKNDELTLQQIQLLKPTHIIISSGARDLNYTNSTVAIIKYFYKEIPILGIGFGIEALTSLFEVELTPSLKTCYGQIINIALASGNPLFYQLPSFIDAALYYSQRLSLNQIPSSLQVIALTNNNEVMAFKHQKYDIYGLLFQIESFKTISGQTILKNFLEMGQQI